MLNPNPTAHKAATISPVLSEIFPSSVNKLRPLILIIANISNTAPPKTGLGIEATIAPNLGINAHNIRNAAPVISTNLFTILVIATSPTFWLKDVFGITPNKVATTEPKPSA